MRINPKGFKEISIVAFTWLKDTHRLAQEQGVKIKKIRMNTQDNKQSIKDNITKIFCIRARYEVHKDRIGRLERVVRNQEKALISQEKKLEEIEEENKKREEEIQAQNSRVDVLCQPNYQEFPAQFTTTALQSSNQLLESQREQEFGEFLQVNPIYPSKHRAALAQERQACLHLQ